MKPTLKPHNERAVKKTISLPPMLLYDAIEGRQFYRLSTFSDYIQHLIRSDREKRLNPA
jgi:hypothetical protein